MFPIKDEISEYTVAQSERKEAPAVVADSQLVVPTFKVSSDQGSDCAYFSGDEGEESLDFNLESEKYQTQKKPKKVDSDDEDYSDFKHQ